VPFRGLLSASVAYAIAILTCCNPAIADEGAGSFKVGGLLFGDIYTIPSHHTDAGDGASGFVLRRGYLTANFSLGDGWRGRARIEINVATQALRSKARWGAAAILATAKCTAAVSSKPTRAAATS
jgi:hypothetical protein